MQVAQAGSFSLCCLLISVVAMNRDEDCLSPLPRASQSQGKQTNVPHCLDSQPDRGASTTRPASFRALPVPNLIYFDILAAF